MEKGAKVSYSVLLPGVTVETGAVIEYAIIGEGCHIGKDCRVAAHRIPLSMGNGI